MRAVGAVVILLLVAACNSNGENPGESPEEETAGSIDFGRIETVAEALDIPWDIAFDDERTILVSERPGRVRLVEDGGVRAGPVAEIDVRSESEAGLLGIALHADFPNQRFVYLYYTSASDNRVSRFDVGENFELSAEEVIVDGIPAAPNHDGGRIAFGPDGMLYIGTGDAGDEDSAADPESLAGKILRVAPDGSTPDDNPTSGSPVYSYGHRNVQGLGWDDDGRFFATEHGPTGEGGLCCHDEINLIEPGGFYGWPFRAGASSGPNTGDPPDDPIDPIAESGNETWAPAGLAVDTSSDGAALIVATLAGSELLRFALEGDTAGEPTTVLDDYGRLRAARFGPDDCLYVTTSNTDGRGSPSDTDDRILRACPSE